MSLSPASPPASPSTSLHLSGNPKLGVCARDVGDDSRGCRNLLADLRRSGFMAPWGRWTPQSHALFPPRVRAEIFTLLLLKTRLALPISRDLMYYMIRWLASRN